MNYRELKPVAGLASVLDWIWMLEGDAADAAHRPEAQPILPDGRPELVLHFGDRFERVNESGVNVAQPWMIYAGRVVSRLLLRPTGRVSVLGVRFHPHGASALFDVPQREVAGLTIGIELLSPRLWRDLQRLLDHSDQVRRLLTVRTSSPPGRADRLLHRRLAAFSLVNTNDSVG